MVPIAYAASWLALIAFFLCELAGSTSQARNMRGYFVLLDILNNLCVLSEIYISVAIDIVFGFKYPYTLPTNDLLSVGHCCLTFTLARTKSPSFSKLVVSSNNAMI